MAEEKALLSWEVKKENKDSTAIMAVVVIFLIAIIATVYYFYQKEYLNAIVFVALSLVLVWYFFASPKSATVAILEDGFSINNQKYKFENFKSYWVSEKTGILYFEPKGRIGAAASMPTGSKGIETIKEYLPEDLLETEDKGDDFMNRISYILKI